MRFGCFVGLVLLGALFCGMIGAAIAGLWFWIGG